MLQITAAAIKAWKVWKIKFNDGSEAMRYKCGDEWVQWNEGQSDEFYIIAIGRHIDKFKLNL